MVLAVVLNVLELFKGSGIASSVTIGQDDNVKQEFPIVIKNQQTIGVASFGSSIAVLGKSNIIMYNQNGKRMNTYVHGYTNPVMKESSKRILTYDRGGTKLRVDTVNDSVAEIQLPFSIITAAISASGNIAVVTAHDRYACEVRVYDSSLRNMLYRYYATEQFSGIAFSPSEQELSAISIDAIDGLLSCNLHRLDITQEIDAAITVFPDVLPLDVSYNTADTIKIIGNDKVVTLDTQTGVTSSYPYKGQLERFTRSAEDGTVFITQNKFNDYITLTSLEADGKTAVVRNLEENIVDLSSDKEHIALLTKTQIIILDMELTEVSRIDLPRSMSRVSLEGDIVYVLGADSLEKHKIL